MGLFRNFSVLGPAMGTMEGFSQYYDMFRPVADEYAGSISDSLTPTGKKSLNPKRGGWKGKFKAKIRKVLGRNVTRKLTMVFGLILSVVNLIFSAIDVARGGTPLEVVSGVFFLLSSTLQVLSAAAGWLSTLSAIPSMLGPLLGFVSTMGNVLGPILALVGLVVFIVFLFKKKPINPVQQFVDNQVTKAGLYMKYLTIEYFGVIPPDPGKLSLVGLSVKASNVDLDQPATAAEHVYLKLTGDQNSPVLSYDRKLDHTVDSVWSLRTNEKGESQIFARKKFIDKKGRISIVSWYITLAKDDPSKAVVMMLPDRKDDPDLYEKLLKKTWWQAEVVQEPEMHPSSKKPLAALCTIKHGSKFLAMKSDPAKKVPIGLVAVDLEQVSSLGPRYVYYWTLRMESMTPVSFSYMQKPWDLYTNQTNEVNQISWEQVDATSSGFDWKISPPLDSNIFEQIRSEESEGSLRMKEGVQPPVVPKRTHTVQCKGTIPGIGTFTKETKIDIEIRVPEKKYLEAALESEDVELGDGPKSYNM